MDTERETSKPRKSGLSWKMYWVVAIVPPLAMFNTPPSTAVEGRESRCSDCGREVYYSNVLHRDNRCSDCHTAILA